MDNALKKLTEVTRTKARARYLCTIKAPKYTLGTLVTDLHQSNSCYAIIGIKYNIAFNTYLYLLTQTTNFSNFWVTEDNLKLYEY